MVERLAVRLHIGMAMQCSTARLIPRWRCADAERKANFVAVPRRAYGAAFAAPMAWKTLWTANGSQNGSEGFVQLDGPFLQDPSWGWTAGRGAVFRRWQSGTRKAPARLPRKRGNFSHASNTASEGDAPDLGLYECHIAFADETTSKIRPLTCMLLAKTRGNTLNNTNIYAIRGRIMGVCARTRRDRRPQQARPTLGLFAGKGALTEAKHDVYGLRLQDAKNDGAYSRETQGTTARSLQNRALCDRCANEETLSTRNFSWGKMHFEDTRRLIMSDAMVSPRLYPKGHTF